MTTDTPDKPSNSNAGSLFRYLETENLFTSFVDWSKQIVEVQQAFSTQFTGQNIHSSDEIKSQTTPECKVKNESKKPPQPVSPGRGDEKFKLSSPFVSGAAPNEVLSVMGKASQRMATNPKLLATETGKLARELTNSLSGKGESVPARGDRRFANKIWDQSPLHRSAKQGYLAWTNTLENIIDNAGLETRDTERLRYMTALITDAMAPSNSLLGNPEALMEAKETKGKSLTQGLKNMVNDLQNNGGLPSQVDKSAFKVGENLAATPGAVVYANPIFELIQYSPTTETVFEKPIMLVPPVVNKYYLLDLTPAKSAVKYLVDRGFQTFMVSWRNPNREHRDWGLDDYVSALEEGLEAILAITGSPDANLYAACTGAVPMSALLGYLAAKGKPLVSSATMVVAVLDSNEGQSLGLFTGPEAIAGAKMQSQIQGVRDGTDMARVFTWMRPNDLVWNYWVNNYLLGRRPAAFDILYWNNDSTRVTAKLHAQLLDVFSQDLLARPGGIEIHGVPIDLSKVVCDVYMVGGATDHISIWKGVYNSAKFFGGDFEFILHSSGHVQAIVSPPGNPKASYRYGNDTLKGPEQWLAELDSAPGSWWDHWSPWLGARSGETRAAPLALGSNLHTPVTPAPGRYVLER